MNGKGLSGSAQQIHNYALPDKLSLSTTIAYYSLYNCLIIKKLHPYKWQVK